jgi:hypothetical protein
MNVKNTCRGAIWIKGIKVAPGETKEIPRLTRPEVMASPLRTKIEIVSKKESRPARRSLPEKKKQMEEDKPVTVVQIHDDKEK